MQKKEEYENLINIVKERTYSSLKHFLDLLEIDFDIVERLKDIPILVDEEGKMDSCALYFSGSDTEEPKILVNKDYLDGILDDIKINKQSALKDATITIIHELLHGNRDIIIKDGMTKEMVKTLKIDDNLRKRLNIDKYAKILDQLITNGTFNLFDKIVPLTVMPYGDEAIVIAYDKANKTFLFYDKQKFGVNKNITYMNVGLELNSPIEHKVAISIPELQYETKGKIYDAAEYYHQLDNGEDKFGSKAFIRTNNQIALEENIIETLSALIYNSRKSNSIDLEAHVKKYQDNFAPNEEALAALMLRRMGIDMIKWFILSCYQEEYNDKLYDTFKDKYNQLLLIFNELRNNTLNDEIQSDDTIDDAIDIIDEKLPKQK